MVDASIIKEWMNKAAESKAWLAADKI